MSTFTDFCNKVYNTVDNKNTRVLPYIKEATVRWLMELSKERMTLLESTFTFTLIQNQQTYDGAVSGFPADAIEFDNVWAKYVNDATGYKYEVKGPRPISEISLSHGPLVYGTNLGIRPYAYAFHDGKMWFSPIPSSAVITVGGEYLRDGTKDAASGNPITVDSTTHTNPWFQRGETALLNAVLFDVYASILKDLQSASIFREMHEKALQVLREQHAGRSNPGGQARYSFGDQVRF